MAVRFAERNAKFTKLIHRTYATSIEYADFISPAGASERLIFAPGITIVSGGNGAGKSTLLGTLWRTIAGADAVESIPMPRTPTWLSSIQVVGTSASGAWVSTLDVPSNSIATSFEGMVAYIDPTAETQGLIRLLHADMQPDDLLEGIDPAPFSRDQLETLSYVLRRQYSELLVYEITSFSEDDSAVPYFVATSMGAQYALDRMGRGELSTAYLLWKLASIPEGAIVFIEEPESHLAVFSQDQLVDAIVAAAVDRDLCIVISTHSPGFFKRLPPNHVSLVSSLPMPSVRSGLSFAELSGHLGVRLGKGAVLLVEDVVALEMLKAIVAAIDRPSLDSIDIRVVESGESGVARCVKDIRVDSSAAVAIAGVLDGDRRPKKAKEDGLVAYLPGSDAPEVVLKGILERWRVGEFPEWQPQVSGGRDSFLLLLERLDGLDLHDWAHQLGAELGGLKIAMQLTIDLLLRDDVLRSQSEQLVAWIRRTARVAS